MPTSFSGTGWPRFPYEVLRHARQGDFQLVLCPFIVDEARSHIAELLPNALTNFEEFLRIAKYEEVPTPSKQRVRIHVDLVRDPADVPVALAAINAAVDCLVSEDKDLTAQDETTAKLRQELKVLGLTQLGAKCASKGAEATFRLGIGRTFQVARTFAALSVEENVEASVTTAALPGQTVDLEVAFLLERLGLSEWATSKASVLPYGVQRRLEIARALGIRPRFLLLDEPAAGLNDEESDELLTVIKDIRSDPDLGCAILIIDHDLRLIMRVCDSIHVLNEGKTIAEGTPKEIRRNPTVIESYLGSSEIL